jgi:predicted neutral ceramidase superfamily lipid hydrolase
MEENKGNAEQQQNESGKVEKKYEHNKSMLIAILGEGASVLLSKDKATNDQIDLAISKLMEKKNKQFAENLENDVQKLIDLHIATEDELDKKEKELKQLKLASKKKFNEEAGKILNRIADQKVLQERHRKILSGVVKTEEETKETPAENQDVPGPNYTADENQGSDEEKE